MYLFILWMLWRPGQTPMTGHLALRVSMFFGFYVLLILTLGLWSRFLARRVVTANLHRSVNRFNRMVHYARWMVPIWFAVGIWLLGWGDLMQMIFPPVKEGEPVAWMGFHSPTMLLGILPGLLTWMGLWWAQFPADRALREQNLLNQLDADLPIIDPPRFRQYFSSNFRMQVLMIGMPMLLIVAVEDVLMKAWTLVGQTSNDTVEGVCAVTSLLLVFLFAPLLLVKVLSTEPLPDSPLRRRLMSISRRGGVKCRDILLWKTNGNVSNAAVIGLVPQVRYVLLSDALLETMTDEHIEAVFAHEMGHVVHRHMVWYAIFFILCTTGAGALAVSFQNRVTLAGQQLYAVASIGTMLWFFGFLSRQCERQADVYAARLMELEHRNTYGSTSELVWNPADLVAPLSPAIAGAQLEFIQSSERTSFPNPSVGRHGAGLFSAALHRVAVVNNVPLGKFEWLHGSIQKRLHFIRELASHPNRTDQFDRQMQRMYGLLLLGFFVSLLWISVTQLTGR